MGFGGALVAAGLLVWLEVLARRAADQRRIDVLKTSERGNLEELANEGQRWVGAGIAPEFDAGRTEWRRRVESFLLAAFGRGEADRIGSATSVPTQVQMLWDLNRRLDEINIRRGYRGWGTR